MEREITKKTRLLDDKGRLESPGYARNMMFEYDRSRIKAGPLSLKEWDFYQLGMGGHILQMTIGHLSYIANFSAKLIDVTAGTVKSFSPLRLFPLRSMHMPVNPEEENVIEARGRDFTMRFDAKRDRRILTMQAGDAGIGDIKIDIELKCDPENEKMVIATPFFKKNQFYLNYKENFYGASGAVKFGDTVVNAGPEDCAVLDWGRGVWPFRHEWFWGNGAAFTAGGRFGFNIGWGFGDLRNASENMFFWNGKAYRLGRLLVERDENNYTAPWKFRDETGCFDFEMTPVFDNFNRTKIAFIQTQCHQVFAKFNGIAVLPDGKKIEVHDMLAFCEHAQNRW